MIRNSVLALLVLSGCIASLHAQEDKHPKRLKYFSIGANTGIQMPLVINRQDATKNYFNGFGSTLFDFGGELSMTLSNAKGWGVGMGFDYRTFSIETDKIQIVQDTGLRFGPSRYPRYIDSTQPGISYDFRRFRYLSYSVFSNYQFNLTRKFELRTKVGFLVRYASIVENNFDYEPTNYHNHSDFTTVVSSSLHANLGFGFGYSLSERLSVTCNLGSLISFTPKERQMRHSSTMLSFDIGMLYKLKLK